MSPHEISHYAPIAATDPAGFHEAAENSGYQDATSVVQKHLLTVHRCVDAYKASMLQAFERTVREARFAMVIVDAPNLTVHDLKVYWAAGQVSKLNISMFICLVLVRMADGMHAARLHGALSHCHNSMRLHTSFFILAQAGML